MRCLLRFYGPEFLLGGRLAWIRLAQLRDENAEGWEEWAASEQSYQSDVANPLKKLN